MSNDVLKSWNSWLDLKMSIFPQYFFYERQIYFTNLNSPKHYAVWKASIIICFHNYVNVHDDKHQEYPQVAVTIANILLVREFPLSEWDVCQDPQWMPETVDSTELFIYWFFLYIGTYLL